MADEIGEYIRLGDFPEEFQHVLMREFAPYSVAMGWVSSRTKQTFTPFGSGTLITKNGKVGILTARHCVTEMHRKSRGHDTVVLVLRDARAVYLPPDSLIEHRLTTRSSDEYGPDLDFLEVAPCDQQRTILAIASVWPLKGDVDTLLREFGTEGSLLASVGFPEERCNTIPLSTGFRRRAYHLTCSHVIQRGDIIEKDGWDYIQSKCVYCEENDLPKSFGGASGGGIWSIRVIRDEITGKLIIRKRALVGVAFYETGIEKNEQFIRGHFIRSVYDLAWRNSGGGS